MSVPIRCSLLPARLLGALLIFLAAAAPVRAQSAAAAPRPAAAAASRALSTPARPPARPASRPAGAAASASASASSSSSAPEGYRIAPTPAWVKPVEAALSASTATQNPSGYRGLLFDRQLWLPADAPAQSYQRTRTLVSDNAGLQEAAKAEIGFNPAYQSLIVHEAAIWRAGVRSDRLKDARIELLRREEGLENQTLTGLRSLLIVLNDVRVGDAVDVAYTITGRNPIYKGHFSENFELAYSVAVDRLTLRIVNATGKPLQARGIRSAAMPTEATEGGAQVLQLQRQDIAPVVAEEGVPPWYKIYPSLHVSDYTGWDDVAHWADDLFSDPGSLGTELADRVDALRDGPLPAADKVAAALDMVQDEVRYFSVSLGLNSHRPKQPEVTWRERVGDCKDKTALLVAMLRRLGIPAQPALVSLVRHKGIADYLPSHDQFDHVITRAVVDGKVWWLDGTLSRQGRGLASRGYMSYGKVLVAAPTTTALTTVETPPGPRHDIEFDQRWDLSHPRQPVTFTAKMTAHGLAAESWRSVIANGALERVAEGLSGSYARLAPGLKATAPPATTDDRDTNTFTLTLQYEAPVYGHYERGQLQVEAPALDLLDWLGTPREAHREMPWLIGPSRHVVQRVRVVGPRPLTVRPPPPSEVADGRFTVVQRIEVSGAEALFTWNYDRRLEELPPADLNAFRDKIQSARRLTSPTLRLSLIDFEALKGVFETVTQRVRKRYGATDDSLAEMVLRNDLERELADATLKVTGEASGLGGAVLAQRVLFDDNLADYASTLVDVDKALQLAPDDGELWYARGLALLSQDKPTEALAAIQRPQSTRGRVAGLRALATAQYYAGQHAAAVQNLQEAVHEAAGDDRGFALLWLYLATQRQDGQGRAAIAPFLAELDATRWPGVLVRHLAGQASADEVLQEARKDRKMERLNLAEAQFYMAQKRLLEGEPDAARKLFERSMEIGATPYIEHMLARVELRRLGQAR